MQKKTWFNAIKKGLIDLPMITEYGMQKCERKLTEEPSNDKSYMGGRWKYENNM